MAGVKLLAAGFTVASHALRCYVLVGYPKDTIVKATRRMAQVIGCGFTPMAMLWRDEIGKTEAQWRRFQRAWARPAMVHHKQEPELAGWFEVRG